MVGFIQIPAINNTNKNITEKITVSLLTQAATCTSGSVDPNENVI